MFATDLELSTGVLSGSRCLDTQEFDRRVRRAASVFSALGIGAGNCVAIMLRNDFPFLEASLGAQRVGAYAVPINWHFKSEEVRYVLKDCGANVLVIHADLRKVLSDSVFDGVTVIEVPVPQEISSSYRLDPGSAMPSPRAKVWDELLAAHEPQEGCPATFADSMIYTSGTTGYPKGVRREMPATPEQRLLIDRMRDSIYGFREGMRTAVAAPLYHSAPNSFALRAGRIAELLILMPRFDPESMLAAIERERLTHLWMVPTMFVRLLKLPVEIRERYDLSSLEFVTHGAAPCPSSVKEAMIDWIGPIVHEYYGGTESGPVAFCDSYDWLSHRGTVGRPIPGARVEIQDDNGRCLPIGEQGEIFMRISHYPDFTYHNLPEKRLEIERDGLITCGDIGYFDGDGFLYICDRKRDMVISGGVNIYPSEIESVLSSLEGVQDCAVFGIPDLEFGETLIALVQPLVGWELQPDAIRESLKLQLANYKVPKKIEIRESLPREDTGKIFKKILREPYWKESGRAV